MSIDDFLNNAKRLGIKKEQIEDLMFDLDMPQESFQKLNAALEKMGDVGDVVTGIDSLGDGFAGLWEVVKKGSKSVWGFITNPLTLGAIAAAAVVAGGAYLE